ncbi:hypothetical protein QBC34DRAFT_404049 [Podospora aff. communis PSN243]|uniref:Uncharacterized protein n=1 Tax=Podospora aff. communis PSN243 TaxID=3040156 RepID=A0AAV9GQU6_9PEZI|nr:hypothetical protein QBC34DRAFT_404049 [Podospora aff. communis PSN243]
MTPHEVPAVPIPNDAAASVVPAPDPDSSSDSDSDTSSLEEWEYNNKDKPIEKFSPAISAIITATRNAFSSSPSLPANPTPEQFTTFQSYWHSVFTSLLDAITTDPTIPEFLTEPPVKQFAINLFTQDPNCELTCPCCLPIVEPSILVENTQGVTKGDLVVAMRDYLYGEEAPGVYEDESWEPMKGALVYGRDWMSQGRDANGDVRVHYAKCPKVWVYCVDSGAFWERSEKERERWEKFEEREAKAAEEREIDGQ